MFCAQTLSGEPLDAATAAPRPVNGVQIEMSIPSATSRMRGTKSPTYWWVSDTVLCIFQFPAMYGRRSPLAGVIQCLHSRQLLALQKFERRTAARRQPVDPVGQAELRDRG